MRSDWKTRCTTRSTLSSTLRLGLEERSFDPEALGGLVREGARRMIQAAIKAEVSEYIEARATALNEGAVV